MCTKPVVSTMEEFLICFDLLKSVTRYNRICKRMRLNIVSGLDAWKGNEIGEVFQEGKFVEHVLDSYSN